MSTQPTTARDTQARDCVRHDPWAQWLGVTVHAGGLVLPWRERHLNVAGGVIHGGIQATLLHDSAWLEAATGLSPSAPLEHLRVLEAQISFLRPAATTDLHASAVVMRQGREFAYVRACVRDGDGRDVASGCFVFTLHAGDPGHAQTLAGARDPHDLVSSATPLSPMASSFNQNMAARVPGLAVTALDAGLCRLHLEPAELHRDWRGEIGAGIQLLAADNVGVFGCFALVGQPRRAATVDLKVGFCEPVVDEGLIITGAGVSRRGDLVQHQLQINGADSGRLKAFGTMTFLC